MTVDALEARGGVVFRAGGALWFLPASIALCVVPAPPLARVPGAPSELCGIALHEGEVIPVLELGDPAPEASGRRRAPRDAGLGEAMLVCTVLGERVGLVGVEVLATGRFEPSSASGEVDVRGEAARTFDLAGVIARVREGGWAV